MGENITDLLVVPFTTANKLLIVARESTQWNMLTKEKGSESSFYVWFRQFTPFLTETTKVSLGFPIWYIPATIYFSILDFTAVCTRNTRNGSSGLLYNFLVIIQFQEGRPASTEKNKMQFTVCWIIVHTNASKSQLTLKYDSNSMQFYVYIALRHIRMSARMGTLITFPNHGI